MNKLNQNQADHPKPQLADRLEQHELRAGETVQISPPKRLAGMPIESAKPEWSRQESSVATSLNTVTRPKIDLSPRKEQAKRFANLSEKQKLALEKLKKMRSHHMWHNAKILIITLLVFILLFNSQWFIAQFMYYFNRPSPAKTSQNQPVQPVQPNQPNPQQSPQSEVVGPENLIIIPKLNVSAPIIFPDTINESAVLVALRDGVVHYYGTANPGENGNAVFFGHSSNDWWEPGNYKFVFVNLERLAAGDTYEIHYNSHKFIYKVQETKVVGPNDLSVLNQTSYPISTLITCTPPGTSWRRFVVVANQIIPAAQQTNQPTQSSTNPQVQVSQNGAVLPSAAPSIWDQIIGFFSGLFGKKTTPKQTQQNTNQSTNHLPEVN